MSRTQIAAMVDKVSMSSDKLEALDIWAERCSNPSESAPIVDLFSFSDDKEAAGEKVGAWSPAKSGEQAAYPIEDDGTRSEEDMGRFLEALDGASMSDDKVAVAEAEAKEHPSPPLNAEQLKQVVEKLSFSDDRIAVLDAFAGPKLVYPLSCEEVIDLLGCMSMSDDKIAILPVLKKLGIKDVQNKAEIVASFSFSDDQGKAEEILRDAVVQLVPPEPPMAKIQEALKKVGSCPSGYAWRQVSGGWRCAAGGHYVSDAALEEAMG